MTIHASSEFGRLREAIVHRPGRELVRMTASTREYFLFDDLLYDVPARQEHDWLTSVLQEHLGIKLHFFDRMLAEALEGASPEERSALIRQVCTLEAGMPPAEQRIGQLEALVRWGQGHGWPQYTQDPEGNPNAAAPGTLPGTLAAMLSSLQEPRRLSAQEESINYLQQRLEGWCSEGDFNSLAEELIEGIEAPLADVGTSPSGRRGPQNHSAAHPAAEDAGALVRFAEGRLFYLTPLPNLMFIRDVAAVVNDRMLLSRMAAPGRTREPLLLDFVQRNHQRLKGEPRWVWADARINDPAWPFAASPLVHLECGNVVQLRDDLLVLGVNARTSMEAVQRVADALDDEATRQGRSFCLYVLRMPVGFNHLDSVFLPISESECVIYPPVFEPYGPASVDVVRVMLGPGLNKPIRSADFFESLRQDGVDFTLVPCGGDDPMDQQREQWFSAVAMCVLAPGKVIIYRSSERTAVELASRGYRVVDINDIAAGDVKLELDSPEKWVLRIKGSELSRGHGGPHSFVLPLVRDA